MKKEKYVLTEVKHKSDFWKNFIAMTIFMLIAEVFVYGVGIVLIYQRGFGNADAYTLFILLVNALLISLIVCWTVREEEEIEVSKTIILEKTR